MARSPAWLISVVLFLGLVPHANAGSIFDNTPFSGAANWAGDRAGVNHLQRDLNLPNAGGAVADFFEQAKKDAGPLVTTVVTLNCPGCVAAAGIISGSDAVKDALFTTGIVTAAYTVSPALGLASVVLLGADRSSGQVGYEQVTVAQNPPPSPSIHKPANFNVSADCLIKDGDSLFALFKVPPADGAKWADGDILNVTAQPCKQLVAQNATSLTSAKMQKAGGNPINMSAGHFTYVMVGHPFPLPKASK